MTRSTISSRRRLAGAATAALLSLGLLTACGSESSDTGASSASPSQKAGSRAGSSDNRAKGHTNLSSPAEGGESNFQQGAPLASRTFQLNVDGGTEALSNVSGLEMQQKTEQTPSNTLIPGEQKTGTMTVVRGAEQSQQFTDLVNGNTRPETASVDVLDHAGNPIKQYTMQKPTVIKVDNPPTGNAQSVTIQFTSLTIS
ncbi:phage tail protein [Streptomyces sp. NPDC055243]|uniref:phage tail protein n=1 Tax=Streptomyces sp. NPDC055243 TaxID=3365720 RepID=UPI0037D2A104